MDNEICRHELILRFTSGNSTTIYVTEKIADAWKKTFDEISTTTREYNFGDMAILYSPVKGTQVNSTMLVRLDKLDYMAVRIIATD